MSFLRRHPPAPPPAAVKFSDDRGRFFRLVARGAALELQRICFYRFWLTTDIRRHLWANTEVDGDAAEYTGLGKELLLGFLFALAILIPVYIAYFLVGVEAARLKAFASFPLLAFFYLLGQFAAYRARRYRLTRTVWRGVRFWMTGSGWSYAWRSMLWGLLLVPSIGLAYPWRTAALERFKLRHTLYGNLPGRLEATGGQLFGRIWWIWLLGLLPFLLLAGGLVAILVTVGTRPQPSAASHPPGAAIIAIVLGTFLLIALPFLHAIRRAREWLWWAGGIRFDSLTVTCDLQSGSLIGVYWALIGFSALVFFAFAVVASGLTAVLVAGMHVRGPVSFGQFPTWGMAAYAVIYLLLGVALGVLARIYTLQRVWQRVVRACAVINIEG